MLLYQIQCLLHIVKDKNSCKNNRFKISAPKWNDKFEILDGSYSVSDFQGYFD